MAVTINSKILSIGLLMGASYLKSSCTHSDRPMNSAIDLIIENEIESDASPGLQYVAVSSDAVLAKVASGVSDVGLNKPIDNNTLFMGYSMTKTLMAIIALRLADRNILDIEESVDQFIPYAKFPSTLKIKHLISQTSGVPNPIPLKWAHLTNEHENISESELAKARILENLELDFEPGTKYSYSNLSYVILGEVLSQKSGKSLEQLFRSEVVSPLGLNPNHIGFSYLKNGDYAVGYLKKWSWVNLLKYFVVESKFYEDYDYGWLRINRHYVDFKPMGGIITNATSIGRILQEVLDNESQYLTNTSRRLLLGTIKNNKGQHTEMTMGWHIGELNSTRMLYKEGGGLGFHCEMRIYPERNVGTVALSNSTTFDVKRFLNETDLRWFN